MQEVKDTLDKKAVFQLMTECYEMHQPDKTKLEDLKNLSGSGNAIQTAKSFALAGGSFIQGVIVSVCVDFFSSFWLQLCFKFIPRL